MGCGNIPIDKDSPIGYRTKMGKDVCGNYNLISYGGDIFAVPINLMFMSILALQATTTIAQGARRLKREGI
jgi:hypothetical protein